MKKSLVATCCNSSRQLQQCRRDRLEFHLNDCCDRLKTCRDGYVLMEQKNDSVTTVLRQWGGGGGGGGGGGQRSPFGYEINFTTIWKQA
jgi:hypothetical protein